MGLGRWAERAPGVCVDAWWQTWGGTRAVLRGSVEQTHIAAKRANNMQVYLYVSLSFYSHSFVLHNGHEAGWSLTGALSPQETRTTVPLRTRAQVFRQRPRASSATRASCAFAAAAAFRRHPLVRRCPVAAGQGGPALLGTTCLQAAALRRRRLLLLSLPLRRRQSLCRDAVAAYNERLRCRCHRCCRRDSRRAPTKKSCFSAERQQQQQQQQQTRVRTGGLQALQARGAPTDHSRLHRTRPPSWV